MNDSATMHTGPLGSTIASCTPMPAPSLVVDWNRCFPMACLDPVRGFITLMAPSRLMRILPGSPTTA